jgi:hypothetical protein
MLRSCIEMVLRTPEHGVIAQDGGIETGGAPGRVSLQIHDSRAGGYRRSAKASARTPVVALGSAKP